MRYARESLRRDRLKKLSGPVERGMFVLGVTGGVGSGKSTVARILEQRGAHVLDADAIVHELYRGAARWRIRLRKRSARRCSMQTARCGARNWEKLCSGIRCGAWSWSGWCTLEVRAKVEEEIDRMRREGFAGMVVVDAAFLVETPIRILWMHWRS